MIRFIVKEVSLSAVVHAGGQPETRMKTFDGNLTALEFWLRFEDRPGGKQPAYISRELVGIELIEPKP